MTKEINILAVLKWVFLAIFILALAWLAFSHSPTLEQFFTLATTGLFFYFTLENRGEVSEIKNKLEKLNTLDEIRDILKERLK